MKHARSLCAIAICAVLAIGATLAAEIPTAADFPERPEWDLGEIFPSVDAWRAAKAHIETKIEAVEKYKGHLGDSKETVKGALDDVFALVKAFRAVGSYATMASDLDTRDDAASALRAEIGLLGTRFGEATSWIDPELIALGTDKIEAMAKDPDLADYRMYFDNLLRQQEHILSDAEEEILAMTGLMGGVPGDNYRQFTNAELPFPEVTLSDGTTETLNQAVYTRLRAVPNREDRTKVFNEFFSAYKAFEATLGMNLYGQVKRDIFYARARKYPTAVASALDANAVPEAVYRKLIEQTNANLDVLHRFLEIRKRMMGLDELGYQDLYVPLVTDVGNEYKINEAMAVSIQALAPLGPDYVKVVTEAYNSGWIDAHPKEGKRQGAYSNGSVYDVHPFVLLNHNDDYESLSTLAHEMGHAMHSYLSSRAQPYAMASYPIFTAEIASTFNEVLLNRYLMDRAASDEEKIFLLGSYLDGIRTTFFRQTSFAEFELKIHDAVEKGGALTGSQLSEIYGEILNAYYGHEKGVCNIDSAYHVEWAYIPHFYYNFYVYQYATGIIASGALAKAVLDGEEGAQERYLDFLKSGGSDYPVNLLKKAGVDLTTPAPYEAAFALMNEMMDEIEALLDKKGL